MLKPRLPLVLMLTIATCSSLWAGEPFQLTDTAAGWVKHAKNPVLGGELGTCFDLSVLRESDHYRMWFSWRPKQSIALAESADGVSWNKPTIVLGPNAHRDSKFDAV